MPLPLTVFEKYMFLDDSVAYPMDSFRFLRFTGRIDVGVFERSVTAVVKLHPLLRSVVKLVKRDWVWLEVDTPVVIKHHKAAANENLSKPVPTRLDITQESGFRVYVNENSASNEFAILFQFHHSVSDGLGEMNLIEDILRDYDSRLKNVTPPENPRNLDAALLPLRGSSGLTLAKYFRYFFDTSVTTKKLLLNFPVPLTLCKKCDLNEPDNDYFHFTTSELSVEETKNYFAIAKSKTVTVNDLLLRDLFTVMNSWRDKLTPTTNNVLLRVSMPVSLRGELHERMPVSNNVTMLFIDRKRNQCRDRDELLCGINRETKWIKRAEQKHVLLLSLKCCEYVYPGGMKKMLRDRECRSTAVMSNLGRVWKNVPLPTNNDGKLMVGDAILDNVSATPPIRSGTLIAFSVLTYANRMRLIMRYDAKNMTESQANDFLAEYVGLMLR